MANKPDMDDLFNLIYKMEWDYKKIQEFMRYIYGKMQDEEKIDAKELLLHLSDISQSMLNTQREFVDIYADNSIKAQMNYKINSKEEALLQSKNELEVRKSL